MVGEFFGIFGRTRETGYSKEPPDDFLSIAVSFSLTIDCTIDLKDLTHDYR